VVVAQPRGAFVGLTRAEGSARAPRRPLTPGNLIPAGVNLPQDGAREGVEFAGAGAPRAAQFRAAIHWLRARQRFGAKSDISVKAAQAVTDGGRSLSSTRLRLEGKAFLEFGEWDREADFRHDERVVVLQD
jgi:hypothetical protein